MEELIKPESIQVLVADESHERYVDTILKTIEEAAKVRGTGIAKRTHEYVGAARQPPSLSQNARWNGAFRRL